MILSRLFISAWMILIFTTPIFAQIDTTAEDVCVERLQRWIRWIYFELDDFDVNSFSTGDNGVVHSRHNFGFSVDENEKFRHEYSYVGEPTEFSFNKRYLELPNAREYQLVKVFDAQTGEFLACSFGQIIPHEGVEFSEFNNERTPPSRPLVTTDVYPFFLDWDGYRTEGAFFRQFFQDWDGNYFGEFRIVYLVPSDNTVAFEELYKLRTRLTPGPGYELILPEPPLDKTKMGIFVLDAVALFALIFVANKKLRR